MAYNDAKQVVAVSRVDEAPFFPDDKIVSVSVAVPNPDHSISRSMTMATSVTESNPPKYIEAQLPPRPRKPFWKSRVVWLLVGVVLTVAIAGVVAGIVASRRSRTTTSQPKSSVQRQNSTMASVASSGLFLKDQTTWNMQVYSQNATGSIQYRMSIDGQTFQSSQNVSLSIAPKVGSPLSATAATDSTGVVYLSLFYLAASNYIAVCQMACAAGSSRCSTTSNSLIKTNTSPNPYTGLAAVNVNDAQDWRVYYLDNAGLLSELGGNSSGFTTGGTIGGLGLNGSSIAAVNVNSSTNNINVFYVDQLTQALFTLEFTDSWGTPATVSPRKISSWNPLSGLGAAYSVGLDQLHVYYTGLDTGIYEFLGTNVSTTTTVWGNQPTRNHIWAEADIVGADITAVGWEDQVRFFQMTEGELIQGSLKNFTWTETFI